jgi:hypothetical protein
MIDKKYETIYTCHANKSLNWLGMDSESSYQHHLETRYKDLEKFGWIDNHFTYQFNSHGFRCKDLVSGPNIMFLGCSQTVGVGIPVHHVWTELVSSNLKMNCANLGVGGSSVDTAFRMCHGYIDKLNPKIVVFMKNYDMRLEIFDETGPKNLGSWAENSQIYQRWATNNYNDYFQREKNTLAIRTMCNTRKIKLIEVEVKDYNKMQIDFARDLAHFGTDTHRLISYSILSKI